MRSVRPYEQPIRVTVIDDEVVFLGEGRAGFSMTRSAAYSTLNSLATALTGSPVLSSENASWIVPLGLGGRHRPSDNDPDAD